MTSNRQRLLSIGIVAAIAMLAFVALSMPAAAGTTNLAGDGSDVVQDFNASDSDYITYTLSSDGTDFGTDGTDTVYMNVTVNDEHLEVSNSSITSTDTSYTFNVSESQLATVPGESEENTTITVNAWGEDTDTGTVNTSVSTFDVTLMFTDERSVVYAGPSAAAGSVAGVDVQNDNETTLPLGFGTEYDRSKVESDNVAVNGSKTDVIVVFADTGAGDPFDQATDRGVISSVSSGDFNKYHQLRLESNMHAVYQGEAPDSDLADGVTYAEATTVNTEDAMVVNLGDSYEDETSLDVDARANQKYGPADWRFIKSAAEDGWLSKIPGTAGATAGTGSLAAS